MAENPYTTEGLLESLKLRGYLPAGMGLTTSQLLQLASEEQSLYIMALLKSIREEFTIATLDIDVTSEAVPLPERAAGAALRTVAWVVDDGNVPPLDRIEPERRNAYQETSDVPSAYMFEGNNVILVPAVSSGTLRVSYQQRLSRLVLPEACGQITAINTGTRTVTLEDTIVSAFTTSETYDFVSNTPNFVARGLDYVCSSINSGAQTMTFSTTLPSSLAVGDWVCLANQTCIPQLPYEVHWLLAARTVEVVLQGQGSSRLPSIQAAVEQARRDAITLLSPRTDGSPRAVVRRGGAGWGW